MWLTCVHIACAQVVPAHCVYIVYVFAGTDRPTLKYLNRFRDDVSAHWYDLGLELLEDNHVANLDNIQDSNNSVNKCCTRMFKLWLDTKPLATWNELLDALQQMRLHDLATKIGATIITC